METLKKNRCLLWFVGIAGILVLGASLGLPRAETESAGSAPPPVLEQVAKIGIEGVLSFLLQTKTTVEAVRLDPQAQQLEITGMEVANPRGFDTSRPAFSAQRILVEASPAVLFSQRAVVRLVEMEGASVNAEAKIGRGFNLKKLLDSVNRFTSPRPPNEKRWILEKGVIKNGGLRFDSDFPPKTFEYPLEFMELSMTGPHGEGVTADKIVAEILSRFIQQSEQGAEARLGENLWQLIKAPRRAR